MVGAAHHGDSGRAVAGFERRYDVSRGAQQPSRTSTPGQVPAPLFEKNTVRWPSHCGSAVAEPPASVRCLTVRPSNIGGIVATAFFLAGCDDSDVPPGYVSRADLGD